MHADDLEEIAAAEREKASHFRHKIHVCLSTGCLASGAEEVKTALEAEIKARDKEHNCSIQDSGCMGLCATGPLIAVDPTDGPLYRNVTPADAAEIVASLDAAPVARLHLPPDASFFRRQVKIVMENSGLIDPERIEDYIAHEGYTALIKAVTEMKPIDVVQEILQSGLRGRGGAGYSTGLKWSTVAKAGDGLKYVICNVNEINRSILESDPNRILEGMVIAAYAVGASQGFIYVRAEYPLAVKRLRAAIKQARKMELLGNAICGTQFSFQVEIRLGAGAFICGEETALIASIEGKRGQPRTRPPYPAELGLWGRPTLINNVETLACIAPILRKGAPWFAAIGTEKSKGTKVFALAGAVENIGLIEVSMGMTLREIIFEIGGGIPGGKAFKAVQTSGSSGGCIPAEFLDMPVDYESLREIGSFMGSGGMIVMDETSCMVDVAKFCMEFCMSESCSKCTSCRVGTLQMHGILEKISEGRATMDDLALLEKLCELVRETSLCGLGQSAPNPVVSTLGYFREEYLAHIVEKRCPAGVCALGKASS